MDSAKAPMTPHGKGGDNSFFREDRIQACSTPCGRPSTQCLFVDANLSSVLEECEDGSVSEGFSNSNNDTNVHVSGLDEETLSEVPGQHRNEKLDVPKSFTNEVSINSKLNDSCMKVLNNPDSTKSNNILEINNNIATKQNSKILNDEESGTHLKTDLLNHKVCNNVNNVIDNPTSNQNQNDEYSAKNDLADDFKKSSKAVNIYPCDNVEFIHHDLQPNQGKITITPDTVLPTIKNQVDSTNVASNEEKVISGNIKHIKGVQVDDGLKDSQIIKNTRTNGGSSSTDNNKLKIQDRNIVVAESSAPSKKDSKSQNCATLLVTQLQPSDNKNANKDKNRFDKFATDEVNVTVTEEDVYFSKQDEISICFDTIKSDTFITIEEANCDSALKDKTVKSIENLKTREPKVSKILSKVSEEVALPPPAKRPRIVIEEQNYRHLEDFISNNACENVDNNDPRWKKYEQLTSDELRYERVREIWRNSVIPNANKNLTTYNWRARNNLPSTHYPKSNVRKYFSSVGGDVSDVLNKARNNAKYLFKQKVAALEFKRNKLCEDAEEKLYYCLSKTDRSWRHHFYNEYRSERDGAWSEYNTEYEALFAGLEERIHSLDKAQEEVKIVSNFYKGLGTDNSRTRLSSKQLNCWFDREDVLNKYEIFYS